MNNASAEEVLENDGVRAIIAKSLHSGQAIAVLSALGAGDLSVIKRHLVVAWETAQASSANALVGSLSVWIHPFPWGEHPALALYNGYLESLGWSGLHTSVSRAYDQLADTTSLAAVPLTDNSLLSAGISRIRRPHTITHGGTINPEDLLMAYLTDSCSQEELRRLGLARNLTMQDRYTLLQCLWQCERGLLPDTLLQQHKRYCIFLNELENVLEYSRKDRRDLMKGLIYLLASLPSFTTLWLNISDGNLADEVREACGDAFLGTFDYDLTGL